MHMPKTLQIKNGEKVTPTFSAQEYANRQVKLRAYMASHGIDAAVFTSYHNINYYSDFLYCAFGRHYGLVVTQDKVVTISANIDGGQPWRRTVGTENIVYTDWQRDNFFVAIQQALPRAARVGIEFDHLNVLSRDKLASRYPDAELVDIAAPCMRMRMIKSAEEHAIIRQGARIADIGGAAVVEALRDQVPEYEVALHATQAMVREIARTFPDAELMDTWTWFQSGLNTDGAHNPVTARKVNRGDILSLNCFPMIAGYYTALERTLLLLGTAGPITQQQLCGVGGNLTAAGFAGDQLQGHVHRRDTPRAGVAVAIQFEQLMGDDDPREVVLEGFNVFPMNGAAKPLEQPRAGQPVTARANAAQRHPLMRQFAQPVEQRAAAEVRDDRVGAHHQQDVQLGGVLHGAVRQNAHAIAGGHRLQTGANDEGSKHLPARGHVGHAQGFDRGRKTNGGEVWYHQ